MVSAVQTAAAGMRSAESRFADAAQAIASGSGGGGADWGAATRVDLSSSIVDLIGAKVGFELNAAVLRTAGEMQKQLVDILA